eukprot:gene56645-77621_t
MERSMPISLPSSGTFLFFETIKGTSIVDGAAGGFELAGYSYGLEAPTDGSPSDPTTVPIEPRPVEIEFDGRSLDGKLLESLARGDFNGNVRIVTYGLDSTEQPMEASVVVLAGVSISELSEAPDASQSMSLAY